MFASNLAQWSWKNFKCVFPTPDLWFRGVFLAVISAAIVCFLDRCPGHRWARVKGAVVVVTAAVIGTGLGGSKDGTIRAKWSRLFLGDMRQFAIAVVARLVSSWRNKDCRWPIAIPIGLVGFAIGAG
jgi:hypothetical protein